MMTKRNRRLPRRRGTILILTALLLVILLGFAAFSIDTGYMLMARTQLQTAADSAALASAATMGNDPAISTAAAKRFAEMNKIGARNVQLTSTDVEYGNWNAGTQAFTPTGQGLGNAVRIVARADAAHGGPVPLFFGKVFGRKFVNLEASAVAVTNPRDICFVVDLSGSMNDDTDPSNASTINASYPGVGTQLLQNVYNDFGWGTYPGTSEAIGKPLGVTSLSALTNTSSSPLLNTRQPRTLTAGGKNYSYTVPTQYQIKSTDSSTVRNQKAYSWVMDVQLRGVAGFPPLPGVMPNVKPTPNSTNSDNYNYWQSYLSANSSAIGYKSYLQVIEQAGRDTKPFSSSTLYSPLSTLSSDCPYHAESTDAGTFMFPPREMPTHGARRSLISALNVIKERNEVVSDPAQRDWVSIVTYELKTHTVVAHSLSGNYDSAMNACAVFQACSDNAACTATETGLSTALSHLNSKGRATATKVVVLITDGKPNLYSSSSSTISSYISAHPNSNFYGGSSNYPQDAAMMQASIIQGKNWMFFPVAIGLQSDTDFMNRVYTVGKGKTGQTYTSPYAATSDPTQYETEMKAIFEDIISKNKYKIVQ
ncbi:MAG: pilus assembly protein TadG-related protein [Pirellulales bacterium]